MAAGGGVASSRVSSSEFWAVGASVGAGVGDGDGDGVGVDVEVGVEVATTMLL
jgi:hypothetical protein